MRNTLLVAFHFPPLKGSSGLERTIGFCRHLPSHGWRPLVLTASAGAYPQVSEERTTDIGSETLVARAFALDAARHFSIGGRYPRWAAIPDRWISWALCAVPKGMALIRSRRPEAVWSTYPLASAHVVGWILHRLSGLPWIADFRDPMVEFDPRTGANYPTDRSIRRSRLWVERRCAESATAVIFCTRGAREIFLARYQSFPANRAHVIPNGYDEDAFPCAQSAAQTACSKGPDTVTLLHSGVLYPGPDRDPGAFLKGLRWFLDCHPAWRTRLRVVLRATGHDARYAPVIAGLGLDGHVLLAPPIPYRDALAEMLAADALMVFQGYTSNPAIPAKLYEYLRARRPILAFLDSEGDTAKLLRAEGVGTIFPIDDPEAIAAGLADFLKAVEGGGLPVLSTERIRAFDRREGARELAQLLDRYASAQRNASTTPVSASDADDCGR